MLINSRVVILPYKQGSRAARKLAGFLTEALGAKVRRVRPNGRYKPEARSIIINYGLNVHPGLLDQEHPLKEPLWSVGRWLNRATYVTNKLVAFRMFEQAGIPTPEWTTSQEVAQQWLNAKQTVVCRTLLNAHSGRGIIMAGINFSPLVQAPLYVLYKKKRREFRVHVFDGKVIDVSQKRRRAGVEDGGYIRNLANGWVFCRDNIIEPPDLRDLATKAVACLGLTFGACDIIWNEKENKCYVLEVNTAPGLEGTTLQRYGEAIIQWIKSN